MPALNSIYFFLSLWLLEIFLPPFIPPPLHLSTDLCPSSLFIRYICCHYYFTGWGIGGIHHMWTLNMLFFHANLIVRAYILYSNAIVGKSMSEPHLYGKISVSATATAGLSLLLWEISISSTICSESLPILKLLWENICRFIATAGQSLSSTMLL